MPDRITVTGIEVWAHHGVGDDEREKGQPFVIDLAVELETSSAAESDDLNQTADYGGLAERARAAAEGGPYQLIETVADKVASSCLEDRAVQAVEVTVHKPQAPVGMPVSDVTVTIRRSR